MRRHAKQDREDKYASRRDYQQVHESFGSRLSKDRPIDSIKFVAELKLPVEPCRGGIGGFIFTPTSTAAVLRTRLAGVLHEREFQSGPAWSRFGLGFSVSESTTVVAELIFQSPQDYVDLWGLAIGLSHFPQHGSDEVPALAELNVAHLAPETFYLDHEADNITMLDDVVTRQTQGSPIELKKCSYCGRLLPIGPGQPGRLSFHKHNAKPSGHQNECRACKKWRINNSFNPLRTADQHNESGLITRERRLLLREPEILQSIKDRQGRGLKSITWDRFQRRCFYCEKPLTLKQVQLDHTRPLAYLWPIDEHATCLCAEHNNHKKDKFPADFYTPAQLERLSQITGLPLADLQTRDVCEPQLQRIRADIAGFAREADARAFNAIARKVREIRPNVDLWDELRAADIDIYAQVRDAADRRPTDDIPELVDPEIDEQLAALEY
ncbi:HNH endonuclease [Shinella sp. H4-D48]|uniref:HNH endonuclease n=1 Tax=Shinella sp. H4-D48 TaxID=2925841 RepID=UPI001F531DBC|nr:HNH endonuclease [Shinella sp. H4-D48]UNK36632.1 HNH endonuclease [Shinella sp. H4-D48]